MKLPPRNSRAMTIVTAMRKTGPLNLKDGMELHGTFRLTLAEMTELYDELIAMGCLERVGLRYCVTEAVLNHYDPPPPLPKGPVVPPRMPAMFRPLSQRFIVSSRGTRDGSNDFREVPSWFGLAVKA